VTRHKGGSAAWRDPSGIENASPEQRVLAAIIRLAVLDARAGDAEAADWLMEDAPVWLVYVTPAHVDAADVHARLLRAGHIVLPQPVTA